MTSQSNMSTKGIYDEVMMGLMRLMMVFSVTWDVEMVLVQDIVNARLVRLSRIGCSIRLERTGKNEIERIIKKSKRMSKNLHGSYEMFSEKCFEKVCTQKSHKLYYCIDEYINIWLVRTIKDEI